MNIEIPYSPRPLQAKLHNELTKKRWGVVVCHRRFGKTVMAINHLLRAAILNTQTNPRYAYIAPTYRQAKAVAWDYLKQFAGKVPMVRFHETELRCDLPNGARIQLLGAENYDSLRGIYLDGTVLDEMADLPESLFPEVIRPALSDRKGWAFFIGTPRGHNAFYDLYEAATTSDEWLTQVYKASETDIVDAEELEAARLMMTEDQFEQEFECSWVANVPGAIFGKELQVVQETGLPHYAKILTNKGYYYGSHNAPHDIEVRELGSGKSRREISYDLGINFRVVPKLPIEDGIHAAQIILSRCWFDQANCKAGLEALRQYHRAYNERLRTFRNSPVHDWASHAADAWRYFAIGVKENRGFDRAPQAIADSSYNPFNSIGAM